MDCKCADGDASEVEFGPDAFRGVGSLDVTAIARGAESVLASTATGSLWLRQAAGGALAVSLSPLDTEAGRRTRELLDAGQPVYARPVWTVDESEFEVEEGVAVVSRASFKYLFGEAGSGSRRQGAGPAQAEARGPGAVPAPPPSVGDRMTPAALILACDGDADATAPATALWVSATDRTKEAHAGAALDLIGQHVGKETNVPDTVLREAVVRLLLFLDNTEGPNGMGLGLTSFKPTENLEFQYQSEYLGSALRRSGVMGLLTPWTAKRAGVI